MSDALPLEWLCCPLSGQRLRRAEAVLLARLEEARRADRLTFLKEPVVRQIQLDQPLEAGLVSEDGQRFYVIDAGLPVLLPDHAIVVPREG